eukprot:TRINITY_DN16498_c0_g1_i3.p1 TRINITY_DN16498_c0_g1~~TRINITY_DN16498_c0_g1_i3.p1  ORF type:complete len:584 (-),score=94.40 TRINITY_DN16498_c0_g1_i3:129-1880(-)
MDAAAATAGELRSLQQPAAAEEEKAKKVSSSVSMGPQVSSRRSMSERLDQSLVAHGLANSLDGASAVRDRVSQSLFLKFAQPLGLVAEVYHVNEDATKAQASLERPRNRCFCFAALLLWVVLVVWLVFQIIAVESDLEPSVSFEVNRWVREAAHLPDLYLKTYPNDHKVKVEASSCLIVNGDVASYKANRNKGVIDEKTGGCDNNIVVDISDKLHIAAKDGGCGHFHGDAGTYGGCWHLPPTEVIGDFGKDAYRFVKLKFSITDPAGVGVVEDLNNRTVEEQMKISQTREAKKIRISLVMKSLDVANLAFSSWKQTTSDTEAYQSQYITSSADSMKVVEMFFRKKVVKRFGRFGLDLLLEAPTQALRAAVKENQEMDENAEHDHTTVWTSYETEYDRVGPLEGFRDDEDGVEMVTAMELFFRATSEATHYTVRPMRSYMQLPEVAGCFFTGFILFAGLLFKYAAVAEECMETFCHRPTSGSRSRKKQSGDNDKADDSTESPVVAQPADTTPVASKRPEREIGVDVDCLQQQIAALERNVDALVHHQLTTPADTAEPRVLDEKESACASEVPCDQAASRRAVFL